ncbi:hypothetical protein PIB30_060586 [Stylosanthes scabra]|uniref:Uncharacterized protein n=1 Tax=Stylosanthes scabra TaxID=79078 RepID=A0ABU6ZJ95_9FABA|nr:hypothetical protein [Stylosanthes scabra]
MARNGVTHAPTMFMIRIIVCFAIIVEFHNTVFERVKTPSPYYVAAENLKECYEKCKTLWNNDPKQNEKCRERCRAKYPQEPDDPRKACVFKCHKR